jgi:hypothetical protein
MRSRFLRLLLLFFLVPPAQGAYECLPGPAPGGLGDWARQPDRIAPGVRCTLALARPAAIDGLAWSYARGGWGTRSLLVSGDLYSFALHEIYRETSVGLWAALRPVGIGLRRWQTEWGDGTRRAGWTWEAETRRSRGSLEIRFAGQGFPIGLEDRSGPPRRVALSTDFRPRSDLGLGLTAVHAASGSLLIGRLAWSPLSEVTLSETVRFPGSTARSGLELKTGSVSMGVWIEPTASLGPRTGIRCAFR